jgi:hypothetical protein
MHLINMRKKKKTTKAMIHPLSNEATEAWYVVGHERKGIDVAPEELIYRILPLHIQRVAGIVLL